MTDYSKVLSAQFKLDKAHVDGAIALIDEGNTIPFIARYRKEVTGSMDDQVLRELSERLEYLRGLDKRRDEVNASITDQGAMTDELSAALEKATTLAELEDIYRPFKPKRKTRASVARAKGLEPLAKQIMQQLLSDEPLLLAAEYVNEENEVPDVEAALAGARDIIAEDISDTAALRASLRDFYNANAIVQSKGAKEEDSVYSGYYEYQEPVKRIAQHRVLAINRGEREGFLKVTIEVDRERVSAIVCSMFVKNSSLSAAEVKLAAEDAYIRLIHPSLEREVRANLTERAFEGAIHVFSKNLEQLLLAPPIKGKVAMALDPGYRMGCKVAVVDATGKVLDTAVVFPVPEFKRVDEAKRKIKQLITKHGVEIIAIGNGTAGRETELFAAEVIHEIVMPVSYMVVSEAGASVYSASKLAAEEFPEYDVNLRSAVSIARRLQDPLAELVK
ncbi:MAG: Tex-like N-terminal domain-containing protein, partial [Oscillospiraceae bacterium]